MREPFLLEWVYHRERRTPFDELMQWARERDARVKRSTIYQLLKQSSAVIEDMVWL